MLRRGELGAPSGKEIQAANRLLRNPAWRPIMNRRGAPVGGPSSWLICLGTTGSAGARKTSDIPQGPGGCEKIGGDCLLLRGNSFTTSRPVAHVTALY